MIALIIIGVFTGLASGFFGIGGGTILVPALLLYGFDIKTAIGISVLQMIFSSIYGSYLNHKKGTLILKDGIAVGLGGLVGASGSGFVVAHTDEKILGMLFLTLVGFSIYRFFTSKVRKDDEASKEVRAYILFLVGLFIGLFAISLGVGGSILLTPILVGFLHYPIKKAVSSGLFFVVFSSISGFLSLSFYGHIDYANGFLVALSSLIGVYIGIEIASKTESSRHKSFILGLYILAFVLMVKKVFF